MHLCENRLHKSSISKSVLIHLIKTPQCLYLPIRRVRSPARGPEEEQFYLDGAAARGEDRAQVSDEMSWHVNHGLPFREAGQRNLNKLCH